MLFFPFKWATLDIKEVFEFTSYIFCFFDQNFPGVTIYENYLVEIDEMREIIKNEKESGLEISVSGHLDAIRIGWISNPERDGYLEKWKKKKIKKEESLKSEFDRLTKNMKVTDYYGA